MKKGIKYIVVVITICGLISCNSGEERKSTVLVVDSVKFKVKSNYQLNIENMKDVKK